MIVPGFYKGNLVDAILCQAGSETISLYAMVSCTMFTQFFILNSMNKTTLCISWHNIGIHIHFKISVSVGCSDAIFCFNDRFAFETMRVAKAMGLRVPEDLALVGFGDMPLSLIADPELSTVVQPAYQLGELAAELMLRELETDEEQRDYNTIVLPTSLLARKSSRRNPES